MRRDGFFFSARYTGRPQIKLFPMSKLSLMPVKDVAAPKLIRLRHAPRYLGVDKNVFNREIRPEISEIRIGRAVLFDRLELDAWADYTKSRCGRPPERRTKWQEEGSQDFVEETESGISRSRSKGTDCSMRALARRIKAKPNVI
jgi:hypothetical protein